MAVNSTPQQAADDWANRLSASGDKITRGVDRVTTAPGQKAVAAKAKMVAAWTDAVTSGKWERKTGAVSLEEWRGKMKEKGIPRIGTGAQAAKPKQQAFYEKFFPYLNSVISKADAMGDVTLDERINKAVFVMREVSKYQG